MITEVERRRNQDLVSYLEKWFKVLDDDRSYHLDLWQDVSKILLPGLEIGMLYGFNKPAEIKTGSYNFDGSAQNFHNLLVAGIFGYTMNPGSRWLEGEAFKPGYTPTKKARIYLDDLEDALYFEFDKSNFYPMMKEAIDMGAGVGTVPMSVDPVHGEDKVELDIRHPITTYIGGGKKKIDVEFFEEELMLKDIHKEYGPERMTEQLMRQMKENPFEKKLVREAIYEREDWQDGFVEVTKKRWASVHYLPKEDDGHVLRISGYDTFPHEFWRWRTDFNFTWGTSIGMDAIFEQRYLTAMGKSTLNQTQLMGDPPWAVHESDKGKIRIKPRGMNYFRDHTRIARPMLTGMNWIPTRDEVERRVGVLRDRYMVAFFTMLMQSAQTKTATEILEAKSEQVAILSPTLIIMTDFITRIVQRVYDHAYKAKRVPDMPDELRDTAIKLRFIGPLPRARQKLQEQGLLTTSRALGEVMSLIPGSETAADYLNMDEVVKHMLRYESAPGRVIREDREVEEARELRAKMMMAERQAQMAQAQGAPANVGPQ